MPVIRARRASSSSTWGHATVCALHLAVLLCQEYLQGSKLPDAATKTAITPCSFGKLNSHSLPIYSGPGLKITKRLRTILHEIDEQ